MRVNVFSRDHIKWLIEKQKVDFDRVNIISINSFASKELHNELNEMQTLMGCNNPDVLFLEFDDVTIEEADCINSKNKRLCVKAMTVEQAKQIINFILKTFNKNK